MTHFINYDANFSVLCDELVTHFRNIPHIDLSYSISKMESTLIQILKIINESNCYQYFISQKPETVHLVSTKKSQYDNNQQLMLHKKSASRSEK